MLVGGQSIGTVDDISLTQNAQAEVKITVDDPLHEGTTAVIRATSLSGIANRYVSIAPGANSEPQIPEDATIPSTQTASPVDIDQLFDTFNKKTREGLANFIQGQGTVYTDNAKAANKAYKFLAPGLQSTTRLLDELTRDQQTFSDFLASGSRVLGAIAERRDDLAALTSNANQALGAIAQENDSFDRSLVALPPALRQANTTFVNLRAALDDLDPLIVATGEATQAGLTPFLRKLGTVSDESVPVFKNLGLVLHRDGPANDLVDTLGALPGAQRRASTRDPGEHQGPRHQPAEDRPAAPVHARPAGVPRPLRAGDVQLRRQRPLPARPADRDQPLPLEPDHERARPDPDVGAVRGLRQRLLRPLPGRLDPADLRLEPVPGRRQPGRLL